MLPPSAHVIGLPATVVNDSIASTATTAVVADTTSSFVAITASVVDITASVDDIYTCVTPPLREHEGGYYQAPDIDLLD